MAKTGTSAAAARTPSGDQQRQMRLIVVVIVIVLAFFGSAGLVITQINNANSSRGKFDKFAQLRTDDGVPILGDPKVTVVFRVFVQLSDPASASYRAMLDELSQKYVATGQARLELRVLALNRNDSLNAGNAAMCAERQRRFWDMQDALLVEYQRYGASAYEISSIREVAGKTGLEVERLITCITERGTQPILDLNQSVATEAGLTGTPGVMYSTDGGKTFQWFLTTRAGKEVPYTAGGVPLSNFEGVIGSVAPPR